MNCLNKSRLSQFNESLLNFLIEKSSCGQFNTKEVNFCINWLLNEYNVEINNLVNINLKQNFNPIYLFKIIDKIIDHFEIAQKNDLPSFLVSETFKRLFGILTLISNNFNFKPDNIKIKNLKRVLNFLSFVQYEVSTKQDNSNKKFLNYYVEILRRNYNMELDELFAIRYKLYGYEKFLKDLIQNLSLQKDKKLSLNVLETLKSASNDLTDTNSVYLILKIVDHEPDNELCLELKKFFWSLFDHLNFDKKLNLVFMIYQLKEIITKNFSVVCLLDKNFDNYFTICMNQVSSTSEQDEDVSILIHIK